MEALGPVLILVSFSSPAALGTTKLLLWVPHPFDAGSDSIWYDANVLFARHMVALGLLMVALNFVLPLSVRIGTLEQLDPIGLATVLITDAGVAAILRQVPLVTPTLSTARLTLVPLSAEDARQIQPLFAQWEIVRFLDAVVPWPYPEDGARRWIEDVALPAVARGEAWHWTLRLKSAPEQVIGAISLMTRADDNRGFWIGVPWQRQGLMTEAVNVVTDFWFNELKFEVLRMPKAVANLALRRISEKTGMRLVGTGEKPYVSGRLPFERWEVTAEEWRRQRAVSVRRLRPDDARPFFEIHDASIRGLAAKDYPAAVIDAWAAPITDGMVERVRAGQDGEIRLVATCDGSTVGIGALRVSTAELTACYVRPDYARRGVGTALVTEIERVALEHGLGHLDLWSSTTAEPFYAARGYQVESRGEFRLWTGVPMAAVKMRKRLT